MPEDNSSQYLNKYTTDTCNIHSNILWMFDVETAIKKYSASVWD